MTETDPDARATSPAPLQETTVTTRLGDFPAVLDDDVVRVRNVRYALAGRFEAPTLLRPDPKESAGRQQDVYACPQPPSGADIIYGPQLAGVTVTEDCLRLSITRPASVGQGTTISDEGLPVLVWVHGGAYVSGAGDLAGYDPAALVREHGFVVVNVTYRLGALGYFGDDGGEHDGKDGVRPVRPANLGLLDLMTALRWVRTHVGAFGGDPEQVTVFGQSAGADAIVHVLGADGADGLVRRAILQSAPFGGQGGRQELHARMVEVVGALDATGPVEDVLDDQVRAAAAVRGMNDRAGMPFAPECGRAPLPSEPQLRAAWRRRAPGLELLVTWTAQDGAAFVELDPKGRALRARPLVGEALFRLASRKVTDALFRRGAKDFVREMGDAGAVVVGAELSTRPVDSRLGAAHAVELGLLFPAPERWAQASVIGPQGARTLHEAGRGLRAAWAEFAKTGRLAADRVPAGPGWTGELRVTRRS